MSRRIKNDEATSILVISILKEKRRQKMDLYLLATFILGSSVWLVQHVSIDDLLTHRRELDSVLQE